MVRFDSPNRTRGFTLIEMMASIGVISLLCALLLPAVQSAREASRRAFCRNNLRQILVATHSYHGVHQRFPAACGTTLVPGGVFIEKQYSALSQILPFADEATVYNSINFNIPIHDFYLIPGSKGLKLGNMTAISASIGMFICPSDPAPMGADHSGGTNYRVNLGTRRAPTFDNLSTNGALDSYACSSMAECTDGLSSTAAFAEKLRGEAGRLTPNYRTDLFPGGLGSGYSIDEEVEACAKLVQPPYFSPDSGLTWLVGAMSQSCYSHVLPPNGTIVDCVLWTNSVSGFVGARSDHPGGLHVGMADGSVHFVKTSVDLRVWRALGTRAAGEIFDFED